MLVMNRDARLGVWGSSLAIVHDERLKRSNMSGEYFPKSMENEEILGNSAHEIKTVKKHAKPSNNLHKLCWGTSGKPTPL